MAIDKTEMMKIVQDKLIGVDNEQDTTKKKTLKSSCSEVSIEDHWL